MKVILGMVQTINGMIAKPDFSEEFISWDSWKIWKKLAEKIGCAICGRRTYELVKKYDGENLSNLKAKKIIISENKNFKLDSDFILANSPKDALKIASKLGFKQVLVFGGSKINSSFMKEKLVDEIVIIVEPYVLGKGIKIFEDEEFENDLKLIQVKKLKSGIVQLSYKVIKN